MKKAKRKHWWTFLALATLQTVWTAHKFVIGHPPSYIPALAGSSTPYKLNSALLNHFFLGQPLPPKETIHLPFINPSELSESEISRALARSLPSSAPGPDETPNFVWKAINHTAPNIIRELLRPLVSAGFHPPSLKMADGIVLAKPG